MVSREQTVLFISSSKGGYLHVNKGVVSITSEEGSMKLLFQVKNRAVFAIM